MKKEDLLYAIGDADDKYVSAAEARPLRAKRLRMILLSAATLMLAAMLLILFVPYRVEPPDIAQYKDSEYYDLIYRLNVYRYDSYLNVDASALYITNFDRWILGREATFDEAIKLYNEGFKYFGFGDDAEDSPAEEIPTAPGATDEGSAPSTDAPTGEGYREITDNQVAGVIEADLIKRTDRHIFYLDRDTLRIFSIAGEQSEELGSCHILDHTRMKYTVLNNIEMFLSGDGKAVTLIIPYHGMDGHAYVDVVLLDVSDPGSIAQAARYSVKGYYSTARMTEDQLLLITNFSVLLHNVDYASPDDYLPTCDTGSGYEPFDMADIFLPEELSDASYTVISMLDTKTLSPIDSAALLSYSGTLYVSRDHIVTARNFREKEIVSTDEQPTNPGFSRIERIRNTNRAELTVVSYRNQALTLIGTTMLDGHVLNQYSMDEYDGFLRVVTTTSLSERDVYYNKDGSARYTPAAVSTTNANLYCLRLSDLSVAGQVSAFAPEGESVRSARFDGTEAYVCTSIQLSDPVFFFDLSDVENITFKDTGTIEGFSSSLVNFAPGLLLGIGAGESWNTLKIEIYRESEDSVVSVDAYNSPYTYYSTDYKSYYIDRENALIGLGIDTISQETNHYAYLLLHFDGQSLRKIFIEPMEPCNPGLMRGVYIDGFFYLLASDTFKVIPIQ